MDNTRRTYTALIADVIKSQAYKKGKSLETQVFVKSALDWLNGVFAGSLKAKAVISSGDEIQGLFFKPEAAFMYYRVLKLLISPVEIRAGIGIGGIDYDKDWDSNELKGDAYYRAREALSACKDTGAEVLFRAKSADDKYINRLAQRPKRAQTETANLIDTAAEFLCPLWGGDFKPSSSDGLKEIVRYKREMWKRLKGEQSPGGPPPLSCGCGGSRGGAAGGERAAGGEASAAMYLTDFWAKGFSTKIAEALGILRQTVDRHIKKHLVEERNTDGTVLTFLCERYNKDTL